MTSRNNAELETRVTELLITRVFDTSKETLFKAWTDPEQLKQWWGPKDFTWVSCPTKLHPGAVFHYCMRSPDGIDMWGRFLYLEIRSPERLLFINSFSDDEGHPVKHPLMPDWPLEILNTLTFTEYQNKTILQMHVMPHSASALECRTFGAGRESVRQGFASTWKQLEIYLSGRNQAIQ